MLEVDGSQDSGGGGLVGLDLGAEDNTTACGSTRQFYEIWMLSVLGSTLVGLSGIFPVFVIPLESGPGLKHGEPAKKLRLMLSFAVGTLLGDVFLHLLPEVWAHIDSRNHNSHTRIGLWVICGLLAFMIVEKLMGDEQDFDHEETKHQDKMDMQIQAKKTGVKSSKPKNKMGSRNTTSMVKLKGKQNGESANSVHSKSLSLNGVSPASPKGTVSHIKTSGYLNLIANVVDNFTHGLAVAGSFCISNKMGLMTTIAILLHEVPHEVGDFAILLRSGFDRWAAAKVQFLTASGGIIGAITALTAESVQIAGERTAWILPFTSGGFMYIALVTVVPDLLQENMAGNL